MNLSKRDVYLLRSMRGVTYHPEQAAFPTHKSLHELVILGLVTELSANSFSLTDAGFALTELFKDVENTFSKEDYAYTEEEYMKRLMEEGKTSAVFGILDAPPDSDSFCYVSGGDF